MPKILTFPEPEIYAGTMSLRLDTHNIDDFVDPYVSNPVLSFEASKVPSNVAPHNSEKIKQVWCSYRRSCLNY